jgi:arabinofuranan 3-O-arabinosyltransferase
MDRVSIIIPVKNSATFLRACLESISKQTYSNIEVLLIDSGSTDDTTSLAKKFHAKVLQFTPKIAAGRFEATQKRNYGVANASGKYVYYVDADMELPSELIEQAVALCKAGSAAVILCEDSFGEGIWARAKNLERMCYWGDDSIEAPRFFKKSVWDEVGGLDEEVGGGGDDWDLFQKLKDHGYQVSRTEAKVRHNEGRLTLSHLWKKRFMYGRDSLLYIKKRPSAGVASYFPIRKAYLRNWRLFVSRPVDALCMITMRCVEYLAGFCGIVTSMVQK